MPTRPLLDKPTDRFPALRARRRPTPMRQLATARQVLERACQQGTLTDEEVARTLQRLEPAPAEAK